MQVLIFTLLSARLCCPRRLSQPRGSLPCSDCQRTNLRMWKTSGSCGRGFRGRAGKARYWPPLCFFLKFDENKRWSGGGLLTSSSALILIVIPVRGEVSDSSSSTELKKTSKLSWSGMSMSSIWSTFTSMEEMLLIGAANRPNHVPFVHICIIMQNRATHVSCSLWYTGVPRTGRRPLHAGSPPRRSAASLWASAAVLLPHLDASEHALSLLDSTTEEKDGGSEVVSVGLRQESNVGDQKEETLSCGTNWFFFVYMKISRYCITCC